MKRFLFGLNESAILDWPLQSHTSPTKMSFRISSLEALTKSLAPSDEVASGFSLIIQSPFSSAMAVCSWPANRTVTASPMSAAPQIGTGSSRCKTIPSPNTSGKITSADAVIGAKTPARDIITPTSLLLKVVRDPFSGLVFIFVYR